MVSTSKFLYMASELANHFQALQRIKLQFYSIICVPYIFVQERIVWIVPIIVQHSLIQTENCTKTSKILSKYTRTSYLGRYFDLS